MPKTFIQYQNKYHFVAVRTAEKEMNNALKTFNRKFLQNICKNATASTDLETLVLLTGKIKSSFT